MQEAKPGIASYAEGLYVRFLLEVKGIRPEAVAASLGFSESFVNQAIQGIFRSERVEAEIARILGRADWNEVIMEARQAVADAAAREGRAG